MLGTPPAFILSQDQTLRRNPRGRAPRSSRKIRSDPSARPSVAGGSPRRRTPRSLSKGSTLTGSSEEAPCLNLIKMCVLSVSIRFSRCRASKPRRSVRREGVYYASPPSLSTSFSGISRKILSEGVGGRETPSASAAPYPPADCTAVLSAMAGLTSEFGMGSGDPRLSGRARGGRSARPRAP